MLGMLAPIRQEQKTWQDNRSRVTSGKVIVIVRPDQPGGGPNGLRVEVEYVREQEPRRIMKADIVGPVEGMSVEDAQALAEAINIAVGAAASRQQDLYNLVYWA